jgi:hypothetical protein
MFGVPVTERVIAVQARVTVPLSLNALFVILLVKTMPILLLDVSPPSPCILSTFVVGILKLRIFIPDATSCFCTV